MNFLRSFQNLVGIQKRKTYKVLETLQEEKYRARHPELVSGSNMFEFNITLEVETSRSFGTV
mgnify:CR=1 FL=1